MGKVIYADYMQLVINQIVWRKPEINQSLHSGFIDFGASSLGVFKRDY